MRRFALICSILLCAWPALAAPSASQMGRPVYTWKTETVKDQKSGAFNHCLVKNMYDTGVLLLVAENHEGIQRLGMHFPEDKMQPGDHYDLTLQVDKRDTFPVEAMAVDARILTIPVPPQLLDQMRKGYQLYLRGPSDEVIYNLKGMDGAIDALRNCIAVNKNSHPAVEAQPQLADTMPAVPVPKVDSVVMLKPGEKEAPSAPVSAPPKQVARATALPTYWHNLFDAAGMAPSQLQDTSLPQPLDYSWKHGDFTIGLIDKEEKNASIAQSLHYLKRMRDVCGPSFVAESSPVQQNKHYRWQVFETACATTAGDTIAALFFVSGQNHASMMIVEGPASRGADSIKLRNKILQNMSKAKR